MHDKLIRPECGMIRNKFQPESTCRLKPGHDGNHCYRYDPHPRVVTLP